MNTGGALAAESNFAVIWHANITNSGINQPETVALDEEIKPNIMDKTGKKQPGFYESVLGSFREKQFSQFCGSLTKRDVNYVYCSARQSSGM